MAIQLTSKQYFSGITIIYFALLLGQLFFVAMAMFLQFSTNAFPGDEKLGYIFLMVASVFAVGGYFASQMVFKKRLAYLINEQNLMRKMSAYRAALIIRWALLEGPCFLSIVMFMITGNIFLLGLAVVMILIFLAVKPSMEKLIFDLQLNAMDEKTIRNPESIVAEFESKY